ncbi:MAG: ATP synthase F1 subunit delta [Gemmatimonadota bacterium]
MSRLAVARNYADTLLTLADRTDAAEAWLALMDEVAALYRDVPVFRAFLETPRVSLAEKKEVIRSVFDERYPESFIRFLLVLMEKRRQALLPEIKIAGRELQNERTGRVHAAVTMTVDPDSDLKAEIEAALGRVLGREVTADFSRDPRLVGGMIVRVKDRVLDGSVRRQLQLMRRALIEEAGPTG